jgi:hypothetical protein
LCWHRPSGLLSKGWAPRTKRSHLTYPCKQVTEAESKAQPTCGCMWLYWLFHFPSAMWPSCFNSFKFYLSALPSPPGLVRTVYCFFFCSPFPATLFPSLMLGPTQGQRASSWSRGLYFHSIITCTAIFLSIMASILVLIDRSTREGRQSNIKHASRIRPITLIRVLNPPKAENHPPNRSLASHAL